MYNVSYNVHRVRYLRNNEDLFLQVGVDGLSI